MKKILTFGLAASTLLIGSIQAQAANITLDSFNTEEQFLQLLGPVVPDEGFPVVSGSDLSDFSADIVGGYRELYSEIQFDEFGRFATTEVLQSVISGNGTFSISYDDAVFATSMATWDGDGAGLDIDLMAMGNPEYGLSLDILTVDLETDLTFTVMGNNGETATMTKEDVEEGTGVFFDYGDFSLTGGTSAELFNDVKSISLEVTGPASLDTSFDNLVAVGAEEGEIVPEPAAVFGLLFSLGCGVLSRKKK